MSIWNVIRFDNSLKKIDLNIKGDIGRKKKLLECFNAFMKIALNMVPVKNKGNMYS